MIVTTWPDAYDCDSHVIYALDENLRIVRCNRAWDTFALENNGSAAQSGRVLGLCLFGVIPPDLSEFYEKGFRTAKQRGQWQHVFNCSSARVIRRLRMTVTQFGSGLLIRNVSIKDTLAPPSEAKGNFADYGRRITMCCHCRNVENKRTNEWQWVPEFLEELPVEYRSRLCPTCHSYHYGQADHADVNSA